MQLQAEATELGYGRRGSGPPLVLLHPLGADRHVWDPVLDRLAEQRDVIAVDLPGFGESPLLADGAEPTPAALAAAVADFLAALNLGSCHLAGNSLGGWVALELALAGHALSVSALAPAGLWARALGPKPNVGHTLARAALPLMGTLLRGPGARRVALAASVAHPEQVPAADALRLVRAYATAPGFSATNAAMRAGRFTALERIEVPVTLGWPEHDRLIARPAHLPATVRNVDLPGCGHLPMWDDPQQVARFLLNASR